MQVIIHILIFNMSPDQQRRSLFDLNASPWVITGPFKYIFALFKFLVWKTRNVGNTLLIISKHCALFRMCMDRTGNKDRQVRCVVHSHTTRTWMPLISSLITVLLQWHGVNRAQRYLLARLSSNNMIPLSLASACWCLPLTYPGQIIRTFPFEWITSSSGLRWWC
jgi:hypothetical protein